VNRAILSPVFCLLAVACGATTTDPTTKTPADSSAPVDAKPATFTEVYAAIFQAGTQARCVSCHSMPPSEVSNGSLGIGPDQPSAYAALVNMKSISARCKDKPLVVPFHPEQSLLLESMQADPGCAKDRMPLGAPKITDEQFEMVRSWINAGALDN
jgi:uncharacterized membrane protein